jgi:hypothetical protein
MSAAYDFPPLFEAYPVVIEALPAQFITHQFLRELSRQQQVLYIEALYAHRHVLRSGKPAPFLVVHSQLAQQLLECSHLIQKLQSAVSSVDLFGNPNSAALWEKL